MNHPICAHCGQPIEGYTPTLNDYGDGRAVHHDCGYQLATREKRQASPTPDLETAWAKAFAGYCYGEEETADARAWFEEGYRAGHADVERSSMTHLAEEVRLYLKNRESGWGINGLEKALEEYERAVAPLTWQDHIKIAQWSLHRAAQTEMREPNGEWKETHDRLLTNRLSSAIANLAALLPEDEVDRG